MGVPVLINAGWYDVPDGNRAALRVVAILLPADLQLSQGRKLNVNQHWIIVPLAAWNAVLNVWIQQSVRGRPYVGLTQD